MRTRTFAHLCVAALPAAVVATTLGAAPAWAHATCSDVDGLGIEVHGQHVVRDYVAGGVDSWPPSGGAVGAAVAGSGAALPGGPGAHGHGDEVARGASFCIEQAQSPGWHIGD